MQHISINPGPGINRHIREEQGGSFDCFLFENNKEKMVVMVDKQTGFNNSITNCVEHVAKYLCEKWNIAVKDAKWIEAYANSDDVTIVTLAENKDAHNTKPTWGKFLEGKRENLILYIQNNFAVPKMMLPFN